MRYASLTPLLVIGCGKMATAILNGLSLDGFPLTKVHIVNPSPRNQIASWGCHLYTHPQKLPEDFQPKVVVLAVKPQIIRHVLPAYDRFISPETLVISVIAGKSFAFLENLLPKHTKVIRTMPNLPATIRQGVTPIIGNKDTTKEEVRNAATLMEAVGKVVWLDSENQLNAASAISGSGPAYLFHLIEAMTAAGTSHGLPVKIATELAHGTVCGASSLASHSHDDAQTLRQSVSSKGGITLAALQVLMREDTGLTSLITEAVGANISRSEDLERED